MYSQRLQKIRVKKLIDPKYNPILEGWKASCSPTLRYNRFNGTPSNIESWCGRFSRIYVVVRVENLFQSIEFNLVWYFLYFLTVISRFTIRWPHNYEAIWTKTCEISKLFWKEKFFNYNWIFWFNLFKFRFVLTA